MTAKEENEMINYALERVQMMHKSLYDYQFGGKHTAAPAGYGGMRQGQGHSD